MKFIVHGYSQAGAKRVVTIDAATEDEAATIARNDGLFPDRIRIAPPDRTPTNVDPKDQIPIIDPKRIPGFLISVGAVILAVIIGIPVLSAINPFKRDPKYHPRPFTESKSNRERLKEYHDEGKFLGYSLGEADQWAKDMDALFEARKQ